ncbi:hypothetical protein [Bradyrhizobium sp. 174]|uniref:hypothetical protein n=1 Tax=Bradyrhizobium sp. 174 TaxID=2782645 RepID=UPI001FF95FB2|nr:hypothetical protein [Bradyrhizobium sp. 174]MCK1577849.1 hypothetical protein [Bradyrhizobium sp. 174]
MRFRPSRPEHGLPNGFVPIKAMKPGDVAWNLATCSCGKPKDFRAELCRDCFLATKRAGETKFCNGCATTLPIDRFWRRSNGGIVSRCKCCCPSTRQRSAAERAARIQWRADRIQNDLSFRVGFHLSATIRNAIKRGGSVKSRRMAELVGCSVGEFMSHIERQWLENMDWANWGRGSACWHLDHRQPISSFDLTSLEQQRRCFHYTNYQPLWEAENIRKGARDPIEFAQANGLLL